MSGALADRRRRLVATALDLAALPVVGIIVMVVTGALEHAEDYAGMRWMFTIPLLGVATRAMADA